MRRRAPWLAMLCMGLATWRADVDSAADASLTSDSSAIRTEFLAALARAHAHQVEPEDSAALRAYPLYPYLQAARFERDLPTADPALDTQIDAFVQEHEREPVARTLRHDWLVSLADRQRWDWFLPRSADVTDTVLLCDRLAARLAGGNTKGLDADALTLWLLPQSAPHECEGVFAWLKQAGFETPEQQAARVRAALAAGNAKLAREDAAGLAANLAAPLLQWAQLLDSSRQALVDLADHPDQPVEPTALLAGFTRLSRTDSQGALDLLPRLAMRADVTPALRGQLQRLAALGAAYDRNAHALAAFADVPSERLDADAQEWRARAALYAGDWTAVRDDVDHMPPALATLSRWRYWRARAVEQLQGAEAAAPLYAGIASLRDFYGYLAADRLQQPYQLNNHATPDDTAAQATLAAAPGMVRAHELFECAMTAEASAEWAAVMGDAQNAARIQGAHLAAHWGWYTQAIMTLTQANVFDDLALRYPRPFPQEVAQAAQLTQLPVEWIWAVMRQESLFDPSATSRADARGLMQLLPSTARAVARRWHLSFPSASALYDPGVAVPLGAAHLREVINNYNGQIALALAAYNAGPAPLARWLPARTLDADVWIENIPYTETRGYVQRILEYTVAYAWTGDREPPRLTPWLPAITPITAQAAAAQ